MTEHHGIEVRGLVKHFKDVKAVDGIDLTVEPGTIYGFLGPNGAGKSTTVLMLTTLLRPTAGVARVGGFDVVTQGADVRRVIGVALQDVALDAHMTAREHMRLQASLHGLPPAEAVARGDQLIRRVGLDEAADRRVGGFSGGMKRRLDLALALVHHPKILFLDEPTTGLDIQSRTALWSEVRSLARDEGATVMLTTQYLEEADALADRVGIIHKGHIVAEGTPAELKAEIGQPRVVAVPMEASQTDDILGVLTRFGEILDTEDPGISVRLAEGKELASVVRALDRKKLKLANLELHAPSLDDVFLAKTGLHLEGAAEEEPQPA